MTNPPSPPPPSDPEPPPTLTVEVVTSDDDLAEAVDEFTRRDPVARLRLSEIAAMQECLRQAVDADVWRMILAIDDAVVERWADVAVEIARWSFEAGRHYPIVEDSS